MPEISRFLGIVIRIYYEDHPPPHFHARYGEHEALIAITNGEVLAGKLPRRAMSHVWEWWELHHAALAQCWDRAARQEQPGKIEPLE